MLFFLSEKEREGVNEQFSQCLCVCAADTGRCVWLCCQVVCLGIQAKAIEDNFTAAHFQAFVFPPAATSDTRAHAATNFLLLPLLAVHICVYVCPKSYSYTTDPQAVRQEVTPYPQKSFSLIHTPVNLSVICPPSFSLNLLPSSLFNGFHLSLSSFIITPCLLLDFSHSPPPFPSLSCCL